MLANIHGIPLHRVISNSLDYEFQGFVTKATIFIKLKKVIDLSQEIIV